MQGEQPQYDAAGDPVYDIPPGHVSGTEAYRQNQARAAAEAQAPVLGTVVQPQAPVVVQPAAVSVVQPGLQPVRQVVYDQQQPVGQVVYQAPAAVQPPAVVVQPPTHAGPHREKFVGVVSLSIAGVLFLCGVWPCCLIPFCVPCDERSVYPPQQQQTSTVVVGQQPAPVVVQPQQPKHY